MNSVSTNLSIQALLISSLCLAALKGEIGYEMPTGGVGDLAKCECFAKAIRK